MIFQGNLVSSRAVWCGWLTLIQGDVRLALRGWAGNVRITGLEDLGMSLTIRGLYFEWNRFPALKSFAREIFDKTDEKIFSANRRLVPAMQVCDLIIH